MKSPPPQPRVLAVVGEDTAFTCLWTNAGSCDQEIPHDAILLIDSDEATNHWMEPGDLDVATLDPQAPGGGLPRPYFPDGRRIAFADGEVWLLANETPPAAVLKFVTITSAAQHDRDEVLGRYRIDRRESRCAKAFKEHQAARP